jgi:outer membrane protein TolC
VCLALWACLAQLVSGCVSLNTEVAGLGEAQLAHYKKVAAGVEFPDVNAEASRPDLFPPQTRGLRPPRPDELWYLSLPDAIDTGLRNNPVIRSNGQFLSPGNPLLANPELVPSVFDPAIQENGVLFGNRGVFAAFSDYDARLSASMAWGRDEDVQNNLFLSGGLPPGSVLVEDSAQFRSRVDQPLMAGGTVSLVHDWTYSQNNSPNRLFTSAYTGRLGTELRQPLWAGAGKAVTGIAGPVTQRSLGITGVNNGVVIAHINQRISQLDFENQLQSLVRDINQVYWDLALAFREYEAEVRVRDSAKGTWTEVRSRLQAGLKGGGAADEAQAEDAYLDAEGRVETALASLYSTEVRLRRLLNMPAEDERVLYPCDAPTDTAWQPDRLALLQEAYCNRLELRKQKASIESLRLQWIAACNLANPRLDFVAGYRLNGFGNELVSRNNSDGITDEGFNSGYGSLLRGNQTSWDLGFEFSMPLYLRAERAQIRQLEFRLSKAMRVLAEQENEIGYEVYQSLQSVEHWQKATVTNQNRRVAAGRRVSAADADYVAGRTSVDLLLRAQISEAAAEIAYHRAVIEHTKAIMDVQYRSGQLLPANQVIFENPWLPSAGVVDFLAGQSQTHPNAIRDDT